MTTIHGIWVRALPSLSGLAVTLMGCAYPHLVMEDSEAGGGAQAGRRAESDTSNAGGDYEADDAEKPEYPKGGEAGSGTNDGGSAGSGGRVANEGGTSGGGESDEVGVGGASGISDSEGLGGNAVGGNAVGGRGVGGSGVGGRGVGGSSVGGQKTTSAGETSLGGSDVCGEETCNIADCGNGIREGTEACDDGNSSDFDDCTSLCAHPICGDRVTNGSEECDDGDASEENGCTSSCKLTFCGDNIVQAMHGEECDEGAANSDTDPLAACSANCKNTTCGDGLLKADEECDDGNLVDSDSCLGTCMWNTCGDAATYRTKTDTKNPNPLEDCDDGNLVEGDNCTNSCSGPACGDGIMQTGEGCDEGELNSDNDPAATCNTNCQRTTCGDGTVQTGEECDDGNASNTDSCLDSCVWNRCGDYFAYLIRTDATNPNALEECDENNSSDQDTCISANGSASQCKVATCGDGYVQLGIEECDDGPTSQSGTCTPQCTFAVCGDGLTNGNEECDDGDGDSTNQCTNDCLWASCGDGYVWSGHEACDDGGSTNDDGCNSNCICEGFACGDGTCIYAEWECDGYLDCANGSDESYCVDLQSPTFSTSIAKGPAPATFSLCLNSTTSGEIVESGHYIDVLNAGNADAPPYSIAVGFWNAETGQASYSSTSDLVTSTTQSAGAYATWYGPMCIPLYAAGLDDGTYQVVLFVDYFNDVRESNESNNTAVGNWTWTYSRCVDTCAYPNDGECDDGWTGSVTSVCDLGTDCMDCGPR